MSQIHCSLPPSLVKLYALFVNVISSTHAREERGRGKAYAMRTRGGVDTSKYVIKKVPFASILHLFWNIFIRKVPLSYFAVFGDDFH